MYITACHPCSCATSSDAVTPWWPVRSDLRPNDKREEKLVLLQYIVLHTKCLVVHHMVP